MRKVVPLPPACQVVSGPFEPVSFDVDGYQGVFPDKSFCKLSRMRKSKNEQKSALELPPNSGGGVSVFIPNLGIILPVYYRRYKLASSVNLYRFTHFLDFPSGSIFVNCLLGQHPQSPLNATYGVGCAFILNTFTY